MKNEKKKYLSIITFNAIENILNWYRNNEMSFKFIFHTNKHHSEMLIAIDNLCQENIFFFSTFSTQFGE